MIEINRNWSMPNKWTFTIKPIKKLLNRYVGNGKGWIDPFAGKNSLAEITNDINKDLPTKYHLDAFNFCTNLNNQYTGILFDPPYSPRQITECYKNINIKATQLDTSCNFYSRVKNAISDKICYNGYAISFGWNSNAFGKNRGFKIIEILLIAHGGCHNDTIVTVEKKIIKPIKTLDNWI